MIIGLSLSILPILLCDVHQAINQILFLYEMQTTVWSGHAVVSGRSGDYTRTPNHQEPQIKVTFHSEIYLDSS